MQLYMAQQVVTHSLPFTAGVVMADYVCVTVSTVTGDVDLSPEALKEMSDNTRLIVQVDHTTLFTCLFPHFF